MNFFGLIFLIGAHHLCGRGVLQLIRPGLKPLPSFCLALMMGVPLVSLGPCFLQLLGIPIDLHTVVASIFTTMAVCALPILFGLRKNLKSFRLKKPAMLKLYELPLLGICTWLAVVSVWRCFYYPPSASDMLSGPELLAEYAVREKTMISTVFTLDFRLDKIAAPNIFKSPFITALQIEYKLLVQPFGQLWLSVLFVSFTLWLYTLLRERIHPIIAGLLLLLFMTIPELYAYTYMILYDYSNMVFFFAGYIFLSRYMGSNRPRDLAMSAVLLGFATYIRIDTLVFTTLLLPMLVVHLYRRKMPLKQAALLTAGFTALPLFFCFLCMDVFIRNFVPMTLQMSRVTNTNMADLSLISQKLHDIITQLIISREGVGLFAYFVYAFFWVFVADVLWIRKLSREAVMALAGVLIIYLGLGIIGYLLPNVAITITLKRSFFKALPLMLWYMCNSGILQRLSALIYKWEYDKENKSPVEPQHATT